MPVALVNSSTGLGVKFDPSNIPLKSFGFVFFITVLVKGAMSANCNIVLQVFCFCNKSTTIKYPYVIHVYNVYMYVNGSLGFH